MRVAKQDLFEEDVVEKDFVTKKDPLGVDADDDRDDAAEDRDP